MSNRTVDELAADAYAAIGRGDHQRARESCGTLLKARPHHPRGLALMGTLAFVAGDYASAEDYLKRSLAVEPDDVVHLRAFAHVLMARGHHERALAPFERIAAISDDADAKGDHGRCLVACGHIKEGFAHLEARLPLRLPRYGLDRLAYPRWDGRSIHTLMVQGEGGYGDMMMFARFLPLALERCRRIIYRVPVALGRLMARIDPRIEIDTEKRLPRADAWVMEQSLPHALACTAIPPQLDVALTDVAEAARGPRLRVGISWGGNPKMGRDRQRSLPRADLAVLLACDAVEWHVLQQGPRLADLNGLAYLPTVMERSHEVSDWDSTARIAATLDLIVTVDTGMLHLAALAGCEILAMISTAPDFRYTGPDGWSPWYDSLSTVRQQRPGAWRPVVERVIETLTKIGERRAMQD